ncbi:retrovirus-related pol polyprotein from transposon TNT 1-94 [Tanacetum coccineum]
MRSFQTKQSVNKTNVSDSLFKQVTQQNLPQNRKRAEIHSNVLKPGMYRIATTTTQNREPQLPHASRNTNPYVSKSSGVNHITSVSRPQLKFYQVKDKVVPNNSQVKFKKKEVEDHHRISSISKKTKSVTAYLNDVNARTKKPNVVPISASKPKRKANKSVATPHKKTVASDTTIQKSKSYHKELYENTNQEWKWWIAKRCPSGYKWTQKPLRTKKIWMPKIRKEDVSTSISPTIDIVSRITNVLKISNSLGSNLSNVPSSSNSLADCITHPIHCTVRFGNDQFAPILGYGDLNQGNVTIKWVYYVEGLNHNLFSVGQFCDADLEVAFRKSTCFVRDLQGNDLLTGRLNLLHMDLCGPMRVASINGKKYILVIVDDYSRYTWTIFLRSKDETPEVLKDFLTMIQRNLQAQVITIRTDKGTEFLNKTLHAYFKEEGIENQTSTPRTPKQNGVVERRNRTLVEAARTMLSASKLPLSFWAEAFDEIKEMMSDHNSSDLVPQRQEMSVENVSSGLTLSCRGSIDTLKSTSGGIQFLGDKLVSWMSKKQNCTAMSVYRGRIRGVISSWLNNVIEDTSQDYGFNYNKILCTATLSQPNAISCNHEYNIPNKHIILGNHFIKEQVENG